MSGKIYEVIKYLKPITIHEGQQAPTVFVWEEIVVTDEVLLAWLNMLETPSQEVYDAARITIEDAWSILKAQGYVAVKGVLIDTAFHVYASKVME